MPEGTIATGQADTSTTVAADAGANTDAQANKGGTDAASGAAGGESQQQQKQQDGGSQQQQQQQAPKPPDKYELKLPDGSTLGDAGVKRVEGLAKELGLTQDQAQKLLDKESTNAATTAEQMRSDWNKQTDAWAAEVKADKDLGGDNYTATVKYCHAAVEKFATPELKKALNETGYGNHPELVRFFAKVGKAMSEDSLKPGGPTGEKKDAASILYPNDTDRK